MSADSVALLTEAEKLARVANAISGAYATELGRVLRDLERALRTLAQEAIDGSRTALSRAVRAGQLRRQIKRALTAAGYDALAETTTSRGLNRLVVQLGRLRGAAQLAAFSVTDDASILALKELARIDVLGQGEAIAQSLWRTLAQGLFSQRPVRDLLEDLSDAIDIEMAEARTLYDTTVSVFGRQVESMKSLPDDVFAYVGPVDRVLRPFCRQHVGRVYTRPQINALDNGQIPNVFLTGGGYNCRHVFQTVSEVSELAELVDTDARIPEVSAQLLSVGGRRAA